MSFSSDVKNEVCRIENITKEEALAEVSGMMKASGTISLGKNRHISFRISTENAAIARRIFKIFKKFFNIHTTIIVKKGNMLYKNNVYEIVIKDESNILDILKDAGIITLDGNNVIFIDYSIPERIISSDECKKAYIRGAFLGGGSISNPEKTYHLEFVTHNMDYAKSLSSVINSFEITSKVIQRKNSFIVYIKEGENIVDLLNIIGANKSLFDFENIRVLKEVRNNVNRLVNCETANLSKTVNASVRQVESIKIIQKTIGIERLSPNIREIAHLRLQNPDSSLKELGKMLNPPIGKSGVNHRLRRIEKIAEELKKERR